MGWRDKAKQLKDAIPSADVAARQSQPTQAGPSPAERAVYIQQMFVDRTATVYSNHSSSWKRRSERDEGGFAHRMAYSDESRTPPVVTAKVSFRVSRNLAGMDNRETTYLKAAVLLDSAANSKEAAFQNWMTALLWGDGKGMFRRI